MLAEDVGDRRADGVARLLLVACLRLAFWPRHSSCVPRGKFFESQKFALGDTKIGELRLQ